MPMRWTVDFFKGFIFLWILFLMYAFQNRTLTMWVYLFMHGSYGIIWVFKDFLFPDERGKVKGSLGSHLVLCIVLFGYWCIPVPLAMRYGLGNPSKLRLGSLVVMYLLGLILMIGSDYQKFRMLKKRKGLISSGFFKYSRNPNYLGEFLIYTSFCILSGHILGFVIFYSLGGFLFIWNIYLK